MTTDPDLVPGDVPAALEALGLDVEMRGEEAYALCPWHKDNAGREDRSIGSFSVNVETGLSYCWTCEGGGTFLELVKQMTGWHGWDAIGWVLKQGVDVGARQHARERREQRIVQAKAQQIPITEASLAVYDAPPNEELYRRHINPEACRHYGIRWDDVESCWILPIRAPDGKLMGWQEKHKRRVRNRPKFIEKQKTLFGIDVFRQKTAVLMESPLDPARIRTAGIKGGLASFGAAVSDEQVRLLVEVADTVILALDNPEIDAAGYRALWGGMHRRRWRPGLVERLSPRVRVLLWNYDVAPDAKDPGDMEWDDCLEAYDTAVPAFMAVR